MERKEMMKARAALIDAHKFSGNVTPAGTVATLVNNIGYDAAREIVALCVLTKGEWDARISEKSRRWAFDLTGTTYGTLSACGFYYPDDIHPAHMEQIAAAMMAYQPAAPQITETRTMDACKLRSVCIKNDWYTRGDNEEYGKLFDRLYDSDGCPVNLTTAKLYEVAQDIWAHSEISDYTITAVMSELARNCWVCFDIE